MWGRGDSVANVPLVELLEAVANIKTIFMSGYAADMIECHGFVDENVDSLRKPLTLPGYLGKFALACRLCRVLINLKKVG